MAWHSIFLNFLFAALVVGGICGSLLWAIATQHRDWPRRTQDIGRMTTRGGATMTPPDKEHRSLMRPLANRLT